MQGIRAAHEGFGHRTVLAQINANGFSFDCAVFYADGIVLVTNCSKKYPQYLTSAAKGFFS